MKRIFSSLTLLGVLLPVFVFAQDFTSELGNTQDAVQFTQTSVPTVVGVIISALLSLLGLVLLILMIYAGFLWMTAGGDTDKTKKAKDMMVNAVIGLIITLAAYSISTYVITQVQTATTATEGEDTGFYISAPDKMC